MQLKFFLPFYRSKQKWNLRINTSSCQRREKIMDGSWHINLHDEASFLRRDWKGLNNGHRHQHQNRLEEKEKKCWLFVPFHVKIFLFLIIFFLLGMLVSKVCWWKAMIDWYQKLLTTKAFSTNSCGVGNPRWDKLGHSRTISNFLITLSDTETWWKLFSVEVTANGSLLDMHQPE